MFKRPFLTLITAAATLCGAGSHAASLELTITHVGKAEGQLLVALFDQPDVWLKGRPLKATGVKAEAGSVTVLIEDLPEGAAIAVSVVHDLNGNRRLDMNAMGMPTESYGFSNNASGTFGPPTFEAARIVVNGATKASLALN